MLALREVSAVIAVFVVLVCEQALAAGERGFSATDKPVAVTVVRKKVSTSPIGSCSTTKTSFNVRIQSIKSKTTSFSRVLMNMKTIEMYASKLGNGTAKHIGICAEMADKGGFAGFSFIDGLCKMFSVGRQPCRCDAGTGDLIYVRDSFWDKQDRVIPRLFAAGGHVMEYVNFPSTVFDQKNNMDAFFLLYTPSSALLDDEAISWLAEYSGSLFVLSRGNEWAFTSVVDTEHCSMGCNASSNFIVRQLLTFRQQVVHEYYPRKFFLSECGRTIQIDNTVSFDGEFTFNMLMSHEGFGCRWYTKEAKDHECTVTYTLPALTFGTFLALSLDGSSSTCEGDSIAIYSGTPGTGTLVAKYTSCSHLDPMQPFAIHGSEMVIVFKRSSKQHQPDGFNFGFSMLIQTAVEPVELL